MSGDPTHYIERLPSGAWGVFTANGRRVALRHTRKDAERTRDRLRTKARKRYHQ